MTQPGATPTEPQTSSEPRTVTREDIERAAASLPRLEPLEEIRERHRKQERLRTGGTSQASQDRADLLNLVDTLRLELRLRLSDDAATAHDDAIEVMRYVQRSPR